MIASSIRPGDTLEHPVTGELVYTVLRVERNGPDGNVAVLVRYAVDQGTDWRYFDAKQHVPLTRGEGFQ